MSTSLLVFVVTVLFVITAAQPARRDGPAVIGPPNRGAAAPVADGPAVVPVPDQPLPATAAPLTTVPTTTVPVVLVPLFPVPPGALPAAASPTAVASPSPLPQTGVPATAVPPAAVPPAAVPPVAVPPAAVPSAAVPPAAVPPVPAPRTCNALFRALDGTCTSAFDSELGATLRAQFSYGLTRSAATPTGGNPSSLPSARLVSNIVCAQSEDAFSRQGLSEMVTFMGQFLDHSIIATPVNKGFRFDIPIPPTDPVFSNFSGGVFPFERSIRALDEEGLERPVNELSSAIDLTSVYGPDDGRLLKLRALRGGLMLTSAGGLLPLNIERLSNAPSDSPRFFVAGDFRANENPMLTSLHTLFLREHNTIARRLRRRFPFWNDEQLFQNAKLINTAQYQKIIFEEYYPAMTGRQAPRYRGHLARADPTISDVFGAAAFRIGHTMVGNGLPRRGRRNRKLPQVRFEEMFFRENGVLANGIEEFIRGAAYDPAQEVDVKVVNALRNFLFTNVPNEAGLDLMALNIQRGRDHAIPSYNGVRELFGRRRVTSFRQITRNRATQTALSAAYGSVDAIDAIVGLFAEDHAPGASMGRTMLRIWRSEFRRIQNGDRFFYRRRAAYPPLLWRRYRRIRRLFNERDTFKKLILRNTNIRRRELRGSVWHTKLESSTKYD